MKFKFGDKVRHKNDGNGLVVAIDRGSKDQPYLVMYGEFNDGPCGEQNEMAWPYEKDLKRGWK